MRDLLTDIDSEIRLSDPEPVRRAQIQMRAPLPKRFYREVSVAEGEGGFSVLLDGKPVRTPGQAPLLLPTAEAARLVAEEWDAQGETIDAVSMPVLRLVNTAIDGVAADSQAVLEDILRYASSDLLCYRAEGPQTLVQRQTEAWDPVVDWARRQLGARFNLAEGVMHVSQPRESIAVLGVHLQAMGDPLRLAALHLLTSLMGSALLALAVAMGRLDAEAAWRAAHIDEDWNIEQWGQDAEAMARQAGRKRDMIAAVKLLAALGRAETAAA